MIRANPAEATPGSVVRDEKVEARRANSTPNRGPYLELGRSRLETWSRADFSTAQMTGQHFYTRVYHRRLWLIDSSVGHAWRPRFNRLN